ncbi:proline-rich receptor-like protein kinase PERK2 [Strongylocentrotus purpuratus]|uniref:Uncharacterized protein n=1 Tax=Strongylocentrotus purpuratus TaxID=7668 RepID=A0A7M7HJZ9_STRPU|nr:proline-rich receptor-like protein kinase PERK2 [Strongylocentrotus purpuratus]|eukprot:XP_011683060.1 PREDICTED: classical arabinogalactan protein 5-like [Strongylocentrotus purpuratus]
MFRWMHQMPPFFLWDLPQPPLPLPLPPPTTTPSQPSAPATPLLQPQPPPPPPLPPLSFKIAPVPGSNENGGLGFIATEQEPASVFHRIEFIISVSVISAVLIILIVVAVILAIVARRRKYEAERRAKRLQMKRASSVHRSFHMTCLHNDMYRFRPDSHDEIKSNAI